MTDREKAIVMAYTGVVMLSGDKLGIYYQYVREKLGQCVMTHELAFPEVQDAIADAAKNDFIELAKGNDAPTVGGWISMKDRLPERGEKVLVISGKYIEVFAFDVICGENAWEDVDGARWSYAEETDYWMPLPEPPEEDKP